MQRLYENLLRLKATGQIQKVKFIQGATVPIIKLVADLQVINQLQTEKAAAGAKAEWEESQRKAMGGKGNRHKAPPGDWSAVSVGVLQDLGIAEHEVDPSVRFLQVDISIDEQSGQLDQARQFNSPSGASGAAGMHQGSSQ